MKQDKIYKASNPTHGLRTSGKLEDCKNISTESLGPKSMNAQGTAILNMVLGRYVQLVTSVMISFDKVMKVVFVDEDPRFAGRMVPVPECARWMEFCVFYVLTIFPIIFGWLPWWFGFSLLAFLIVLNEVRYEVVRLSNY